jgi:Fe-S-cluster containining protein
MAFYEQNVLRFHCTGCGKCCSGDPDYYVFLDDREAEKIRRSLGLTALWFKRRYLRRTSEDELVINNDGGGRCVFLNADNTCRIYAERPLQCRTYPFWPETVRSRAAWRREALRCEGIDHGGIVPLARIRAALARHKKGGTG